MCRFSFCLELSNLFCFQDYLCFKFEATGTSYSLPQVVAVHAITHGRVKRQVLWGLYMKRKANKWTTSAGNFAKKNSRFLFLRE